MEFIILVWRWTWKHTLPEGKLMNMGFENQKIWGWHFCWATTYQWCWCLMYSVLLNCYWLYQEISAKACGNPQTISIGLIPGPLSISREDWPPPRSLSSRSPRRILYDIMVTSLLVSLIGWSWWSWGKHLILLGRLILVTAIWSFCLLLPQSSMSDSINSTFTREYSEHRNHIERISPGRPVAWIFCRYKGARVLIIEQFDTTETQPNMNRTDCLGFSNIIAP